MINELETMLSVGKSRVFGPSQTGVTTAYIYS
jgi:hypothetical protein